MDRLLKVYAPTGHLFAQFDFFYDHAQRAGGRYTEYRRLGSDDEEDEDKRVFPLGDSDFYPEYREFKSIEEIRAHDQELVKREMGREMTVPGKYTYVYEPQPVLQRYLAETRNGLTAMINVTYSFIDNTKEVKFLSGVKPQYDFDLSSNSLETNVSCILRIPVFRERDEPGQINTHDLKRLEPWY